MKKLLFMLSIIAVGFTACEKEGDIGPQGEKGEQGVQGEAGEDGNANVIGTNEFIVSGWNSSGSSWNASVSAPGISQDVVNTGIVQVFRQYGSEWWALPDVNADKIIQFGYSVGNISLQYSSVTGATVSNPGAINFRAVIIPSSNIEANPNTDWTNYSEVCKV